MTSQLFLLVTSQLKSSLFLMKGKNISACYIVCVDKGVQNDAPCADRVSVQMPQRVEDRRFVRTPVRRFVRTAVCMHKGKDGHVHQLCGLSITHLLPSRAKQVHVQQCKVAARVEKKKVEVPKYKFIWQRKEVQPPRVVSSRAGQEGGRGVEGRQDLKTSVMRNDCVDITPPFRADPQVLGTTLFEGGRMIWARRRR
jgi:hypothetical protein